MSIRIGDNFEYRSKNFLDKRSSFSTLREMLDYPTYYLPDGFVVIVQGKDKGASAGKQYIFNSHYANDPELKQWREYNPSKEYVDLNFIKNTDLIPINKQEIDDVVE